MNTAVHDVTTAAGGGGNVYGPNRVGSGRVDASLADHATRFWPMTAQSPVSGRARRSAWSKSRRAPRLSRSRTVDTAEPRTRACHRQPQLPAVDHPDRVCPSRCRPRRFTVAAGATGDGHDHPDRHRDHRPRPWIRPWTRRQDGLSRDFTPLASGRLLIDNGSSTLRLPVSAAVKPVSTTTAHGQQPGHRPDRHRHRVRRLGHHGRQRLPRLRPVLSVVRPRRVQSEEAGMHRRRSSPGAPKAPGTPPATSDTWAPPATTRSAGASGSAYFAVNAWSNWTVPGTSTAPVRGHLDGQ